jgi:hypothetical protein
MFKAANAFGGLNRKTLPTELIPLNSIQLARGLLNFAVIQGSLDWVLPFWAERQYDPDDRAFVPRSHLGLSVNVTHRNWTAIGNPDCAAEPIVDPCGLIMPLHNGWTLDTWAVVDGVAHFPSRCETVYQRLINDLPVVETRFSAGRAEVTLISYTDGGMLVHNASVRSVSQRLSVRLAFAIRPFNPEGVALLHHLDYRQGARTIKVEDEIDLSFSRVPDRVFCSTYAEGDSATALTEVLPGGDRLSAHCEAGLANGFAAFDLNLREDGPETITVTIPLETDAAVVAPVDAGGVIQSWRDRLAAGTQLEVPEARIASVFRASMSTLLMFTDGTSITPGPFTYHQFWFRDAPYMLLALNRLGFAGVSRRIIETFPLRQERSGYFRSQQGEWDSNGQVLLSIWQYVLYGNDPGLAEALFHPMQRAVRWIDRSRLSGPAVGHAHVGLLPAGLSAEHLGLSDFYFWDNFWSVAGLEAFIRTCELLDRSEQALGVRRVVAGYREDLGRSIATAQTRFGLDAIPAGPYRDGDCGMIESCCAWYPLQIYGGDDPRCVQTTAFLSGHYMKQGMFFQHFIHSGMNAYLSLHLAECLLYAGDREGFWRMVSGVLDHASPTWNYPEAIHPLTLGGAMGDGHHGWAAAEIVLALRNAFVYELWNTTDDPYDLVLLGGIPVSWFSKGLDFGIHNAPIPGGTLSITVHFQSRLTDIRLSFKRTSAIQIGRWKVRLPIQVGQIAVDGAAADSVISFDHQSEIALTAFPNARDVIIQIQTSPP